MAAVAYCNSEILQIWLETPIRAAKTYIFGGFDPLNIIFHHRDSRKALPWRKTRRNRSSGMARTRCEEYTNKKQSVEPKHVTNWVFAPPTPLVRS